MGGNHIWVVLLPCNKQKQHWEGMERPNYSVSIPYCFTMQLLIPELFTPFYTEIFSLNISCWFQSLSCSLWLLIATSSLLALPLTSLPSSGLPSSSSLIPFLCIQIFLWILIHILAPSQFSFALCFIIRIWLGSTMGLAPLWSWKVYPVTHPALPNGFPSAPWPSAFPCVVSNSEYRLF